MTLSRRKTLGILGGGMIVAATGLGVHVTRKPNAAIAPWAAAGGYDEPRMRALSYAILAPNPHNRQPWLVDLSVAGDIGLYVDTEKMLPHTDPFNRQITIGLGCFLEVLRMAAAEDGYKTEAVLFPEGADAARLDGRPVATVAFARDADVAPDPLFGQIMDRRSLKEPFDVARPVADADLAALVATGSTIAASNAPEDIAHYRDLTERAMMIEIDTPRTYQESVDLFRIGRREVNANPDGIDFSGPLFETLDTFGLFTREAAVDRESVTFSSGIDAVLSNTRTAMAHIWITTPGNTRPDQIAAGRDWVRLNLATTARGIGIQPLSQILQEYPEMDDLYQQIHKELAPGGETVQMFARLGYGKTVDPSPRWPLEAKIMNG